MKKKKTDHNADFLFHIGKENRFCFSHKVPIHTVDGEVGQPYSFKEKTVKYDGWSTKIVGIFLHSIFNYITFSQLYNFIHNCES